MRAVRVRGRDVPWRGPYKKSSSTAAGDEPETTIGVPPRRTSRALCSLSLDGFRNAAMFRNTPDADCFVVGFFFVHNRRFFDLLKQNPYFPLFLRSFSAQCRSKLLTLLQPRSERHLFPQLRYQIYQKLCKKTFLSCDFWYFFDIFRPFGQQVEYNMKFCTNTKKLSFGPKNVVRF